MTKDQQAAKAALTARLKELGGPDLTGTTEEEYQISIGSAMTAFSEQLRATGCRPNDVQEMMIELTKLYLKSLH